MSNRTHQKLTKVKEEIFERIDRVTTNIESARMLKEREIFLKMEQRKLKEEDQARNREFNERFALRRK